MARLLFSLACLTAAALALAVLAAPYFDGGAAATGWGRIAALFAHDAALRRTSLASAAGLVVSACVFFQPARRPPPG